MSDDDEPLWTSEDVARHLQVSRSWVEHNAPRGVIPSIMIGRMRRFRPAEIRRIGREGLSGGVRDKRRGA